MEIVDILATIDNTSTMALAVAVIWIGKSMLEGARLHDQKVIDRLLEAVEGLCADCEKTSKKE